MGETHTWQAESGNKQSFLQREKIITGACQGSALGRCCFNLPISDQKMGLSSVVVTFADDKPTGKSPTPSTTMLGEWATRWQVRITVSAKGCIYWGTHTHTKTALMGYNLEMNSKDLEPVVENPRNTLTPCSAAVKGGKFHACD